MKHLLAALRMTIGLTVLTGLLYPGIVTGLSQLLFRNQADGSLITKNGHVIGSILVGQNFAKPEYFHPRPSSAGADGYDASSSSGSNLGPTSAKLIRGTTKMDGNSREIVDFDGVDLRIVHYCVENGIPYKSSMPLDSFKDAAGTLDDVKLIKAFNNEKAPLVFTPETAIPADAVTGSGSGLDPHISPASAQVQATRIAKARNIADDDVNKLIANLTERPSLSILGDPRLNVLQLNLALDSQYPTPTAHAR